MFSIKRPRHKLKGTVFLDSNLSGKVENSKDRLCNVTVKLYKITAVNRSSGAGKEGVTVVYNERLVGSTRTDKEGKYSFYVDKGIYSLSLDLNTLPPGKGVVNKDIFVGDIDDEDLNFIVRDIEIIEITKGPGENIPVDSVYFINPVIKDKAGRALSAKLDYSCESEDAELRDGRLRIKPGAFRGSVVNISISSGNKLVKAPIQFRIPDADTQNRIRLAYNRGIIDEKTKILYYLYSLFEPDKLGSDYRSGPPKPVKSGTIMMEEIKEYISRKDADKQLVDTAKSYISRSLPALDREYTSPSGFFKIHYTTSEANEVSPVDTNGSGVPDYIELMGSSFDRVKEITCDERGFREPILDKGKNVFDVYVYDLKGIYGITHSLKIYEGVFGRKRRASCYISMDNSYSSEKGFNKSRDDCMRVTAAHEFFHAVQYAYNVDADKWWKEASATWNEDEIYSSIDDYIQYIDNVFSSPEKSLEESSYGGVVFAKYLSEKWGGYSIIKRIWDIQSNMFSNSIRSIDRALREKTWFEGIEAAYNEFTAYNFNPQQYYEEGKLWKEKVSIKDIYTEYPVASKSGRLDHMAASYQLFKPVDAGDGKALMITVDGTDHMEWGFKVQKRKKSDNLCDTSYIATKGTSKRAEIMVYDFGKTYNEVCLIPANLEKEKDDGLYTYSAKIL